MPKSGTDPATIFTFSELYRGEKEEWFSFIVCICCVRKPRPSVSPFYGARGGVKNSPCSSMLFQSMHPGGCNYANSLFPVLDIHVE